MLKANFARMFEEATKGNIKLTSEQYRFHAINALLDAWNQTVTFNNSQRAFAFSGIHPFNTGVMLGSRGVNLASQIDTEKELRKSEVGLRITSTELTDPNFIVMMKEHLSAKAPKSSKSKTQIFFEIIRNDIELIDDTKKTCQVEETVNKTKRIKAVAFDPISILI